MIPTFTLTLTASRLYPNIPDIFTLLIQNRNKFTHTTWSIYRATFMQTLNQFLRMLDFKLFIHLYNYYLYNNSNKSHIDSHVWWQLILLLTGPQNVKNTVAPTLKLAHTNVTRNTSVRIMYFEHEMHWIVLFSPVIRFT